MTEDPVDQTILKEIPEGRTDPADIADATGLTPQYVRRRLSRLEGDVPSIEVSENEYK